MSGFLTAGVRALLLALILTATGCRSARSVAAWPAKTDEVAPRVTPGTVDDAADELADVAQERSDGETIGSADLVEAASLEESAPEQAHEDAEDAQAVGHVELDLDWLISEVLRRNPTRQAAIAAWHAAAQRYPQAVALDDPMLQTMIGPRGLASDPYVHGGTASKTRVYLRKQWLREDLRRDVETAGWSPDFPDFIRL